MGCCTLMGKGKIWPNHSTLYVWRPMELGKWVLT